MQTHRILVIDNDQEAVEAIMDALEPEGFLVFSADAADEGIDKAKKIHPSLMFVNIVMPGQSGLHVCKELQAVPGLSKSPIIMLTIREGAFDPRYTELFGILDVLKKPLDPDRVLDIAHKYLKTGVALNAAEEDHPLEKNLDSLFSNLSEEEEPEAPVARPVEKSVGEGFRISAESLEAAISEDQDAEVEMAEVETSEMEAAETDLMEAEPMEAEEPEAWSGGADVFGKAAVEPVAPAEEAAVGTGGPFEEPAPEEQDIFVPDLDEAESAVVPGAPDFSGTDAPRTAEDDAGDLFVESPVSSDTERTFSRAGTDFSGFAEDDASFSVPDREEGFSEMSSDLFASETDETATGEPVVDIFDAPPRKKSRLPLIAGAVVLLLALAGGAWFFFLGNSGTPTVKSVREPIAVAPFKPADESADTGRATVRPESREPVPAPVSVRPSAPAAAPPPAPAGKTASLEEQVTEEKAAVPAAAPAVAAAKPEPAAPEKKASSAPATPPKRATKPAPAKLASGYGVQVGAFSKAAGADEMAGRIQDRGYPTAVVRKGGLHKVIVGPYPSWVRAKEIKEELGRDSAYKGAYLVSLPLP